MGKDSKKKGSGLKYVALNDFSLVPRPLIEQIKPAIPDIDRLYAVMQACGESPSFWAINFVGVFADHQHMVKGFMWFTLNPVTRYLTCNCLSVDREYQGRIVVGEAKNIARKLMRDTRAAKLVFQTSRPKAFAKAGFKRAESVLMELEE